MLLSKMISPWKLPRRRVIDSDWLLLYFIITILGHVRLHMEFTDQVWSLHPLQWKHGVFTTEPPGKSYFYILH